MEFDEFMRVFHAAVAAVENGEVAEVDLDAECEEGEGRFDLRVCIRRHQFQTRTVE